jgi:Fur family ferric uptake transcriptional regulator
MVTFFKQHNCKDELKEFALKATPARLAVMKFLETAKEPVDVNTIIGYLKSESLTTDPATVFRMMHDFVKKGVTRQIQFEEGKSRYELSAKGDHHHLICEKCGKVEAISDTVIPEMEKGIRQKHHFLVKRHSLEFFGLCSNCQN